MDAQLQESLNRSLCVLSLQEACNPAWNGEESSYEDARRVAITKHNFSSDAYHNAFQQALRLGFIVPGLFPGDYKTVPCCCEYCDSPASENSELETGEKICLVCKENENDQI